MAKGRTRSIPATIFSRDYGRIIDEVAVGKATVIVTNHGRPQMAIVRVDEYEELLEARRRLAWTRPARPAGEPTNEEGHLS